MKQKSAVPTQKVTAGAVGGIAIAPLLIWGLGLAGIAFPPAAAAAAAGLLPMLFAYLKEEAGK